MRDIYTAVYPMGTHVRVADRPFLEGFLATWKYHHKLRPEQLEYAGKESTVEKVSFYHGGDQLYDLKDIPGIWHEQCLRAA
jgi:hypothetical protein